MAADGSILAPKAVSRAIHDHASLWEPSQQPGRANDDDANLPAQTLLVRPVSEPQGEVPMGCTAAAGLERERQHQKEWMRHYIRHMGWREDEDLSMVHEDHLVGKVLPWHGNSMS